MNRLWYRSGFAKAVLIVMAHIFAVVSASGFLWILGYPALREEILSGSAAMEYQESRAFIGQMLSYSHQALSGIAARSLLETDGEYDPDKLVDIETFHNTTEIDGKDTSGFCYRLGDLIRWGSEAYGYEYDEEAPQTEIYDVDGMRSYTVESTSGAEGREYDIVVNDPAGEASVAESYDSAGDDDAGDSGEGDNGDRSIVVCQKSDDTYHYYKTTDFIRRITEGEYRLVLEDQDASLSELLENLYEGGNLPKDMFLEDSTGALAYVDFWFFDGYIPWGLLPVEEINRIVNMANADPRWNGRLSQAFEMLEVALGNLSAYYQDYTNIYGGLGEGDTNFSYIYADTKDGYVYTNREAYGAYEDLSMSLEKLKAEGKYIIVAPKLADFETDLADVDAEDWRSDVEKFSQGGEDFLFAAAVDTDYPVRDSFYTEDQTYARYAAGKDWIAVLCAISSVLFLLCLGWLSVVAGQSAGDEEIHLNWFDRWKTEIAAGSILALLWLLFLAALTFHDIAGSYTVQQIAGDILPETSFVPARNIPYIAVCAGFVAAVCALFLIGWLSLVRRIKAGTVWKNSVLRCVVRFAGDAFGSLGSIWRTVLLFGGFVALHWFAFLLADMHDHTFLGVIMLAVLAMDIAAFVRFVYRAIGENKIREGIARIAGGEVDYKIRTEKLKGGQRDMAEEINTISSGLDAALEESMKSERLKTDLIANVSHDIKTPLTSIINYVDLLKKEDFEDPKVKRYLEILEQKSQRLKTLTEDVVEASKISSGNIALEYADIDLVEMIRQTSGEFEEKFRARRLKEVLALPGESVIVRADGRRIWRVLENIYNNAAKYAMEGTRVYAELKSEEGFAVFSLKNVSEQPLNISADELTERFIRGDISRSTEGSGLGLSIARSLTEMQGGTFELYLDGDLFKVTIKLRLGTGEI